MKFLLDVCVSSRSLTAFLVAQGHDGLSALSIDPRASDERLLELSVDEQVQAISELLDQHGHELLGQVIVTIARGRIRIRRRNG